MPLPKHSRITRRIAASSVRICIVGEWHQASVLSACFAAMGHSVKTIGTDPAAIAELNRGKAPVVEPRLNAMLCRSLKSANLQFLTDYREALQGAEFVFLSIDTPVNNQDEPQLDSLFEAASCAGKYWRPGMILCVTSQVPVGTCERLGQLVSEQSSGATCDVACIPEFLRLGDAVNTFYRADRFVIGSQSQEVAGRVAQLYLPLGRPVVQTSLRSAEMAKHACNSFLATSVSFINEISDLCDRVHADSAAVAEVMKLDRRIGPHAFLSPGLGFAGGTLGRDIRALQQLGRENGCDTRLMEAVMSVNRTRTRAVKQRLLESCGPLGGLSIGVLGITYKSGTSTLRNSVGLELIAELVAENVEVRAFDPLANWKEAGPALNFAIFSDPYALAEGCDALVLVTAWKGARESDLQRLRSAMRRPVFIDTRSFFDAEAMSQAGFLYSALGRGSVPPAAPTRSSHRATAGHRK